MNLIDREIEKFEEKFSVMIERAGRENGESPEEWMNKIEYFLRSSLQRVIDETRKETLKGKIFDKVEITEEYQIPKELVKKIQDETKKKCIKVVKNIRTFGEDKPYFVGWNDCKQTVLMDVEAIQAQETMASRVNREYKEDLKKLGG